MKTDRAPAVDKGARRSCPHSTRARHPCGTREGPLRAASFRTWLGSQDLVAQDPTLNASCESYL